MNYRSATKSELARAAGCSAETFRLWLRRIAPGIPDYSPKQKILTPAQVKYICESLCIDFPPEPRPP